MPFDDRDLARVTTAALLVSALAWTVLVAAPHDASIVVSCRIAGSHGAAPPASLQMLLAMNPPGVLAAGWMLMLVAMMAPALILPLHQLRIRSLARRRARTVALFVAAYAAIWVAAGAGLMLMALVIAALAPQPLVAALAAIGGALLWQCSPIKQRCLNRCHAQPELAAFGRAADVDALRFGARHGLWCVGSCWALMLVPVLLPRGHLVAMAAVTVLVCAERLERPRLPSWRLRGLGKATRIVAWRARALAA
jgi:predicted metal-binding membrane protein